MRRRRNRSRARRRAQARRDESAFLFDPTLSRCLGRIERVEWELTIDVHGGDVEKAAEACGLVDVPRGAKALWGRNAEEAVGTYRRWQTRKRR